MATSNACWGIEIGAGAVKALKIVADGDELSVAEFAYIPHPRVLSTPDIDPDDAKRVALGRLVSEHDLSKATVAVSVPGHSAFARFAKLPPVERKKVPDIVKFEAVQQIPFPLEEVEWDYQTFVSPDSPDVEVGIFAITKQRVAAELAVLRDVNLTPDVVTLSPVAVYNAMAYDLEMTETSPGTILLDVGTTSTDLVIAHSGRVWVRTFPIGGHEFTNALVEQFKLSYPKAEKLKREAEQSKHARHVFQALRPVFSDLVQDVQRSIGYYQSMHPDAKLERLVGMGSTFELPGLRKYLKQQLGMNVYRLEGFKRLSAEGPQSAEFTARSLNFATAYGLALQGLGRSTLDANLMPVAVAKEAMWASKGKWFAAAAGLSLVATGAMFIRPFLDQQHAGTPEPLVIADVANRARQLSGQATEAGVTADVSQGEKIATMLSLYEGRGTFLRLVADVDQMLVDTARQGDGEGFELEAMYTTYLFGDVPTPKLGGGGGGQGRGGPGGASLGGEMMMPEMMVGRGNRDRFPEEQIESRYQTPAVTAVEEEEDASATGPRVAVNLRLSTTRPDVEVFVLESVKRWLERNAGRPGVPYTFAPDSFDWSILDQRTIEAAAPPAGGGRGQPGREIAGRGGNPDRAGGRRGMEEAYLPEGGGEVPGLSGRGGFTTGGGGQDQPRDASQALSQLDQMAPLPADEDGREPGTVETTLRVTFVAVLGAEAGEEDER
jgi:type IV pilus assembly protein PilM